MCEMLAGKLESAGIPFTKVVDKDILRSSGITHVPVLQVDDGEFMNLAAAMRYIKGVTA